MRAARLSLGAVGIVLVLVGCWRLVGQSLPALADVALFLAGGVLAHDLLLAPLVVLAGVGVARLPVRARPPAVVGLVVLGSVTLMAAPVIGRSGARPDVPSLLDRPYGALWLGFAVLVLATSLVAALVRRRSGRTRRPG